jgi:hypothetical protein
MNNTQNEKPQTTETKAEGKQTGFFGRIFQKLDDSMKQKAETKSKQSSCCGGKDGKGGKCC